MESKSFFSKIIFVLLILTMLVSIIFADTNGIWERAADILPGIFGSDEGYGPFAFWGTFLNLKDTTLNVSTNTKAGIVSNSQNNNAITGIASKTGTSAIKGVTSNEYTYSGYFTGGRFYVNSYPITFANSNFSDCTKLYTDTNGHVLCGIDYYLSPGYGLYKSGYNTINVNTNVIQNRVTGSCPNGAIKLINPDGSVSCASETDPQVGQVTNGYWCRGTGTQVTCDQSPPVTSAGYGLYRSGNSLGVNTNIIQNRVTGACGSGYSIRQINPDGSVVCQKAGIASETDPQVGQVTNGYWCRGTGTQVTCDQSPPVTSAGYGLYRSGNSLGVNTNTIQNRVTGSCPNGAIKQINVDGSVSCYTPPSSSTSGYSGSVSVSCFSGSDEGTRTLTYQNGILVSVSSCYAPACFLAGTKITLANGSTENIEDILPGQKVLSYNEKTSKKIVTTVVKTFEHPPSMMPYYLIINNKLRVTPNHPMYVNGHWEHAGEIKVGDYLMGLNGKIKVFSVKKVDKKLVSYNLEVSGVGNSSIGHDYFADGILVHNK